MIVPHHYKKEEPGGINIMIQFFNEKNSLYQ